MDINFAQDYFSTGENCLHAYLIGVYSIVRKERQKVEEMHVIGS